jgi:hypothetical protein
MKLTLLIFAITAIIPSLMSVCGDAQEPAAKLAHTRTEFSFTVDAPFDQVVPLFGANEERKWAGDWNPQVVYPIPGGISGARCSRSHMGSITPFGLTPRSI